MRHRSPLALTAFALLASACADAPSAPATPSVAPAAARGAAQPQVTLAAFLARQGTYCGTEGQFCHPTKNIGSILGWASSATSPNVTLDFAGVNARWYLERLGRDFGYAATGSVHERVLADGRRVVSANVRFENTLVAVYPGGATTAALGADFEEYGAVEPVTASGTIMLRFVLPAGYVGLPDVMQVIFEPLPGMELLQLVANLRTEGALRGALEGSPAGTNVRMSLHTTYLPKLAATGAVHSPKLVRTFFEPSVRIAVRATGR